MALRYLTLKEPQYVPSYNTLDMSVVNTVDADIQRQGEIAQQYSLEQGDMLREGIQTQLSPLGQTDQQYASRVLQEEQQAISDYVDQNGARRSLDFINQRVNRFKSRTNPLFEKAGAIQSLNERLKDSKAPGYAKNEVLSNIGDVEYDESGEATGFKSGLDQARVETVANWVDLDKWIQDFNSGWKANSQSTAGYSTAGLPEGEVQYYKESLKGLGFDNVNATTVAAMLNNYQIRNQLEMAGEVMLKNAPEGANLKRTSNGGVETVIATPRRNQNGEFLNAKGEKVSSASQAQMIKETKTFNSLAEWQATMKATPYSSQASFIDYSYEIKAPESLGGGKEEENKNPNGVSNRWQTDISQEIESVEAPKWYVQTKQEFDQYDQQSLGILEKANGIASPSGVTILPNKETGGFKVGTDKQVFSNLEDALTGGAIDQGTYNSLKTQEQIREATVRRAQALDAEMKNIENNVFNQLSRQDNVNSDLLNAFSINDKGEVVVDDADLLNLQVDQFRSFDPSDNDRWSMNASDRRTIQNLNRGESTTVTVHEKNPRTGSLKQRELVVTNQNGETKFVDKATPEINSLKDKIQNEYQKQVDEMRGVGHTALNGWALNVEDTTSNSLDKRLTEHFKLNLRPGSIEGQGNLVNSKGETIEMDDNQIFGPPYVIFFDRNGTPSISGTVMDKNDEEPHHKNAVFTGTFVSSALRDLAGDQYQVVTGVKTLSSYFPKVLSGQQESATLTPTDLVHMGIYGSDGNPTINQNVKVTYRKYRRSSGDGYLFDITDPETGARIANAETIDELYFTLASIGSEQ